MERALFTQTERRLRMAEAEVPDVVRRSALEAAKERRITAQVLDAYRGALLRALRMSSLRRLMKQRSITELYLCAKKRMWEPFSSCTFFLVLDANRLRFVVEFGSGEREFYSMMQIRHGEADQYLAEVAKQLGSPQRLFEALRYSLRGETFLI